MIRPIDRVISDLCGQGGHFRTKSPHAVPVGVVGLNHADFYISCEGGRIYRTGDDGTHPTREAPEAERRLRESLYQVAWELPLPA